MNIKKEELINVSGKSDCILLKNQKELLCTGQDQTLKILKLEDFQIASLEMMQEIFFKCFQISDQEILLVGSQKLVTFKLDNLNLISPLENFTETILDAVVKDKKVYLLFQNEVFIFDLESKQQQKVQLENCQNIKQLQNKVYIKQGNNVLQIVKEDESQNNYSTKKLLEHEQGFQDYLVINDVVFIYSNQKVLKKNKEGIDQVLTIETQNKLFKMFVLNKDRMLLSFDEELVLIDYEKKQVLSTLSDIKQVQVVIEKENDSFVFSMSGNLYQINTQGLFSNQKKRKALLDQSDEEEEEVKEKENNKDEKEIQKKEEKNSKDDNTNEVEQENKSDVQIEIKSEKSLQEVSNNLDDVINNQNQVKKQQQNLYRQNDQNEFIEFCEVYPQEKFTPGTCEEQNGKELLKKNIYGEIIKYGFEKSREIQVVFSDHQIGKFVLQNEKNYTLGDINQNAFILGVESNKIEDNEYEEDQQSQIYFKEILRKNEWEIRYDEDFKIQQIMISNMLIYILSDQDELRVYNYGGIEIFNRNLNGPVVCMSSFQHIFSYVYQNSLPLYGRQNLMIEVFDFYKFQIKSEFKLSLTPYSYLTWFGYSDDGILYCQDEKGYIRMCINNQYWIIIYRPIEERVFWLYGIMDKELIGYRLGIDQKNMNLDRNYNTFKIIPKCNVYSKQEEQNKDQQDIIYQVVSRLNERQKYEDLKHLKHTVTSDFHLKILQEKILNYEEQQNINTQLEYKKLELARQLITQGDESGALYQMLQIRQENFFQAGIELFEELKYKKLVEQLKVIAQERGIMMNFQKQIIVPQYESIKQQQVRDEKMRKYLEESDKQISKDFFNYEKIKDNTEDKSVKESIKINQGNKKIKKVNKDLLGVLDLILEVLKKY